MIALPENAELFADLEATARAAAACIVETCAAAATERIAICLSGGSTPRRLYELMGNPEFVDRVPWPRLHLFFGDERIVPEGDPASNLRMVREALGEAPVSRGARVYAVPTGAGAQAGAQAYAAELRTWYGAEDVAPGRPLFDLVLLGLGSDGHTASLFPGKPAIEAMRDWVAPVPDAGLEPFVPRITLTLPILASARTMLFLVNGASKREPLRRLAAGEDLPAARVARSGRARWFVDEAAANV